MRKMIRAGPKQELIFSLSILIFSAAFIFKSPLRTFISWRMLCIP